MLHPNCVLCLTRHCCRLASVQLQTGLPLPENSDTEKGTDSLSFVKFFMKNKKQGKSVFGSLLLCFMSSTKNIFILHKGM